MLELAVRLVLTSQSAGVSNQRRFTLLTLEPSGSGNVCLVDISRVVLGKGGSSGVFLKLNSGYKLRANFSWRSCVVEFRIWRQLVLLQVSLLN